MTPIAAGTRAVAATAGPAMPAMSATVTIRSAPATTRLANREFRLLALGDMPFGARQRCADQRSMDGAVILANRRFVVFIGDHVGEGHRVRKRFEVETIRKLGCIGQIVVDRYGLDIGLADGARTVRCVREC